MLAVWGYVEADFRRDYGIDLTEELPHMSWRKFQTLLHGLSPWGALATNYDKALKEQLEEERRESNKPDVQVDLFWKKITSIRPRTE